MSDISSKRPVNLNDTASIQHNYPGPVQAWSTVAILFLAYTLSFIDRQIITLLVGPIRADLGLSDFQFSLLHGFAFAIFFAVLGLPVGRMADRYSRRVIIAVGIATWSFMTALCGLAKNFPQLFLARMGVGVGEATLSPSTYSMLSDAFPPDKLTRAVAVFSTGGTLGTGLAMIIGGAVIQLVADAESIAIPFVGELKPWQASFLIVGIPGLIVAAMMFLIPEPKRQGLITVKGAKPPPQLPLKLVFDFLIERKGTYGTLFLTTSFMTALSAGFVMWYPTFLIRIHGYSMSEAGYSFGLLFGIFGTLGVLSGGWLAGYWARKGHIDANMRVMVFATSCALIPYIIGPQMPSANLAMAFMAISIFATQMIASVSVASTQLITPNQIRAQASAIFLLLVNFIGFGLGGTVIAFFTDFVFASDNALPYSMSLTAIIIVPASIMAYWKGIPAYRVCLEQAKEWR